MAEKGEDSFGENESFGKVKLFRFYWWPKRRTPRRQNNISLGGFWSGWPRRPEEPLFWTRCPNWYNIIFRQRLSFCLADVIRGNVANYKWTIQIQHGYICSNLGTELANLRHAVSILINQVNICETIWICIWKEFEEKFGIFAIL